MVEQRRGLWDWHRGLCGAARGRLRLLSSVLILATVALLLAACSSSGPSGGSGVASTAAPTQTSTAAPTQTSTTPSSHITATASTSVTPSTPTASLGSYLPLFPFASSAGVVSWQQSFRSGGHQPWHLDAGQTALAFAAWLGYRDIDTVTGTVTDGTGAHVSVGFHPAGRADQMNTSAVVHLMRWGSGSDIPWEVVGTDDTTFSLDRPAYGSAVKTPVRVGGTITGVDENIKIQVRRSDSPAALGTFCCLPAGGSASPWNATVEFSANPGTALTIAAQTGGHVAEVERFAVTGVRVSP